MKSWPLGSRVGILGGGQLARMLAHAGQQMGFEVHVLCREAHEPAAQVTSFTQLGSVELPEVLKKFLNSVDFLTFESEFINIDLLESVLKQMEKPPAIFPNSATMRILQNRKSQKEFLANSKLPTTEFKVVATASDLLAAQKTFPNGFVLKKVRGGYDGNGTFYVRSQKDFEQITQNFPGLCIAEKFISFKRELATTAVCGEKDFFFLPLVESKQTQSRCDWVVGPTKHAAWTSLAKKIQKALDKINYRGVIAFELFDTGKELLINEIAPRVHNSAHYSMDALSQSQFDLHLLAGLGLRFSKPTLLTKNFVMTNLVGESDQNFDFPNDLKGHLHWYGKKNNRPGRKMGHLNYLQTSLPMALKERKRIQK